MRKAGQGRLLACSLLTRYLLLTDLGMMMMMMMMINEGQQGTRDVVTE